MKTYVSLINVSDEIYLIGDKNGIMAFKTITDGLDYYEKGYKQCHSRSYESSMSVLLNNI